MDRHCAIKTSVIVLLQPMDCQRAVYVHGGKRPGASGATNHPAVSPQLLTSDSSKRPLRRGSGKRSRTKIGPPTFASSFFFVVVFLFCFDTQSSLKLTTVYAVSEDSHRGGPVLLGGLTNRTKHTHAHTQTHIHTHTWVKCGDEWREKCWMGMFTCLLKVHRDSRC